MIARSRPFQSRNRKSLRGVDTLPGSAIGCVVTLATAKARLTFPAPVVVAALPLEITRQAGGAGAQLSPTAYTVVSPTIVDLAYAAACVATDKITVPSNVAEIRGIAGGYIVPSVTTF
jgi:hypothetical protein